MSQKENKSNNKIPKKQEGNPLLKVNRTALKFPADYLREIKKPDELSNAQRLWLFRDGDPQLIIQDIESSKIEVLITLKIVDINQEEMLSYLAKAPEYIEWLKTAGEYFLALGILHQAFQAEIKLGLDVASCLSKDTNRKKWLGQLLLYLFDLTEDIGLQAQKIIDAKGNPLNTDLFNQAVGKCLDDFVYYVKTDDIDIKAVTYVIDGFIQRFEPSSGITRSRQIR